ncbi:MAG: RagB/SusD family nutrient uptake outer membrane protein [Flavobacteriaceae bacterium]|nr:RagB/SusD family nutrient uptake outer membrane protein [Flavobacteriaceae bacterium]
MKMKRNLLNTIKPILAVVALSLLTISCTNLELEATDSIVAEGEVVFEGVADVEASITNLYNDVYGQMGDQANFFALNEVSTDETLVPTRGTDWGDNGIWRTLHAHTWSPTHQYILNTWNNLNQNVLRASQIIDPLSAPNAEQEAQARFLRAFSMYFVLDFWGVAPFRAPTDGADVDPDVLSASEAYAFILEDLNTAIPNLPNSGPSADNNRATRAAGNFLKAKVILNADRYGASPDYNAVISAVDAISAAGYGLQAGYFDIFKEDVDNETIWFANTSVGNRIWNGLHYNQNAPDNTGGGWNGFTTLAEFYDSFEGNPNTNNVGDGQEERRGFVPDASNAGPDNLGIGYGFLIGQQYEEDGSILRDRPGDPLVFTKDLPGLSGNGENTGIRIIKYHPVNGSFANHEIIFRYADAHLMKAEAMMRSGGNATPMVNDLRALRGASPLGNVGEAEMLAERGRELYVEFWRRNDLLRFGQFTKDWAYKDPASVGDSFKNLYPIPINALLSNPNLVQNPGY